MSDKRKIVANTAANAVAQVSSMLSGLIFLPLLIARFGLTNYGLYLLASSVMGYVALLDLGVGAATVQQVAAQSASGDGQRLRRTASTALCFYSVVGLVAGATVFGLALSAGMVFRVTPDGARLLRNLLLVAAASSLIAWPLNTAIVVLQGFQKYTVTARTTVLVVACNICVTAAVLWTRQGPLVLLAATSLVGLLGAVLNAIGAARVLGGMREVSPLRADAALFRSMAKFSWPVFTFQVVTLIIGAQTDRLVLGVFMGAAFVTLYEGAAKFPSLLGQVTSLMTGAVMPLTAQLDAENRRSAITTLFLRGSKYTVAVVTPLIVTLMVLARPILVAWLGPQFAGQDTTVRILLSYWVIQACGFFGFTMIVGLGKLKGRLFNLTFLVTLGNLVLSVILVRPLGIIGVVLGTAIPQLIDLPFNIRYMVRETGTPWRRFFWEVVTPTYPMLIVPLTVSAILGRTGLVSSLPGVAAAIGLSAGAYWLGFMLTGLSHAERHELAGAAQRLRDLVSVRAKNTS